MDVVASWTFEELQAIVKTTLESIKCPPNSLKGFDVEDRLVIRAEENGYSIMADAILRKLGEDALSKSS